MGKKSLRRQQAKDRVMAHAAPTAGQPSLNHHPQTSSSSDASSSSASSRASTSPFHWLTSVYNLHYKKLLIFPILLFVLAVLQIGLQVATTGDFLNKGVSLKGGITATIPSIPEGTSWTAPTLERALREAFPSQDINVRAISSEGSLTGFIIETGLPPGADENRVRDEFVSSIQGMLKISDDAISVEAIGSSLGDNFFRQTISSLYVAFLFMGMVVFLYFGIQLKYKIASVILTLLAAFFVLGSSSTILHLVSYLIGIGLLALYANDSIPSIAVILAAFSDIIETIAVLNLLEVKLSTAGIAALLMLIGYSVDTDILLTTRVLKRQEGSVLDGVYSAIMPGMLMSLTTIVAVVIGLFFSKSEVLSQIMLIVLIGLVFDVINTWIQNAGIIRWYLEKKSNTKLES